MKKLFDWIASTLRFLAITAFDSRWCDEIFNWLLPSYCLLCHITTNKQLLCAECYADLPWLKNACPCCANLLPDHTQETICGNCLSHPPMFHATIALFAYEFPITQLILKLKFQQKLVYARLFAELFIEKLQKYYAQLDFPEMIIPVPLHPSRLHERGYNQSLEIARTIGKTLNIQLDTKSCQRIKATLRQSSIPAHQRKKNIKKAFAITSNLQNKHIAILDDVVTTGNTIAELARIFKNSGVKTIDIWCCAHTQKLSN